MIYSCVMPADAARWKKVPVPRPNSVIYFAGVCGHVGDDGVLDIVIDDLLFNLGPSARAATTHSIPSPPAKRLRFDASAYLP